MGNSSKGVQRAASGLASRLTTVVVASGLVLGLHGCGPRSTVDAPPWPDVVLSPHDRLLILAPHPDDETLGCGGIIQHAVEMGLPLQVVFFTYGDNNQWSFTVYRKHPVVMPKAMQRMGLIRRDEALAAAKTLGLAPNQLVFWGYPDFGTLQIWDAHWGDRPPFHSMLTRVAAVPYPNALHPGAPYKGEEVLRDLTMVLRDFRPTKVFVSHPGDQMADHLALYLFTRVALWDLEPEMKPELYPYLIHFKRWPSPRGFRPTEVLKPPATFNQQIAWLACRLSPREVERKRTALKAHRSQYGYSAKYLLSFVRPNELFGDFPVVRLRPSSSGTSLSANGASPIVETPEELTDLERAAFMGLEWQFAQLEGDQLALSIKFSRPLAEAVEVSVHIFGYRADRSFVQMPKLHITLGALTYGVYDQDRKLPGETVSIRHQAKQITIRVPLSVLGDPQKILTSARTSLGDVPLDSVSWRILALSAESLNPL